MDRRSVVVGLVAAGGSAVLVLSGCGTREDERPGPSDGTDTDPDRRLVATALNAELALVDALERTRRRHPGLRDATIEALRIHRDHVGLLRGTADDDTAGPAEPTRVPGAPAQALRSLVRLEGEVSAGHVSTAMGARSGSLARVVASMSVAAAQLQQELAREAAAGGGA